MPPVRLGLLAVSSVANRIIEAAPGVPNLIVASVASRSPLRAASVLPRLPGADAATYEELLARKDIDAIYISIPNSLHFEWALKAVRSGKHVLIEKPAVLHLPQLAELALAAEKAGVVVMEAMWYRYHSQVRFLRDLIRANALGSVRSVTGSFCFQSSNPADIRWDAKLGGGAILDLFCYQADLLTHILGIRPEDFTHVEAFARYRNEVPASVHAEMRTSGGTAIGLTVSIERDSSNQTVIVGETGSCLVPNLRAFPEMNEVELFLTGHEHSRRAFARENSYTNMLAAFVAGVRGKRGGLTPLADTSANLKIMEKIAKACRLEMADRTALLPRLNSKTGRIWQKLVGTPAF